MTSVSAPLDVAAVRGDFPILERRINGRPLVYLDSAATSQKPRQVLDAMDDYYRRHNANVHRGVHTLAEEATQLFEEARGKVARFVGASERATVFTKNVSEAINLVAYAWGLRNLRQGDEILVTEMEHHSNLVPWQLVAGMTGARIKAVPVTGDYLLDLEALDGLLGERTRMVAVSAMPGRWSWPTPPRPCPTPGSGWTSWGSTSSGSPGTRRSAPWGSGCWPPARSCWTAWSRSSAGAR
jgi:cysteine desulfurase/selenocysteine lyase